MKKQRETMTCLYDKEISNLRKRLRRDKDTIKALTRNIDQQKRVREERDNIQSDLEMVAFVSWLLPHGPVLLATMCSCL